MLLGEDGECFSSHVFINREIIALFKWIFSWINVISILDFTGC